MHGLVGASYVVGGVMIDASGVSFPYERYVIRRVNVCVERVGVIQRHQKFDRRGNNGYT